MPRAPYSRPSGSASPSVPAQNHAGTRAFVRVEYAARGIDHSKLMSAEAAQAFVRTVPGAVIA